MGRFHLITLPAIYRTPRPEPEYARALPGDQERYLLTIFRLFRPEENTTQEYGYFNCRHRPDTKNEADYFDRLEAWHDQLLRQQPGESKGDFQLRQHHILQRPEAFIDTMGEYKIHFQVFDAYKPYFLRKLCYVLDQDKTLGRLVRAFKVSAEPSGGHFPEAVIYVHPNSAPLDQWLKSEPKLTIAEAMRRHRLRFIHALARLWHYFDTDAVLIGNNAMPRYNVQLNRLIFAAQSSGDLKEALHVIAPYYFDPQLNYAFRIGEPPPSINELYELINS